MWLGRGRRHRSVAACVPLGSLVAGVGAWSARLCLCDISRETDFFCGVWHRLGGANHRPKGLTSLGKVKLCELFYFLRGCIYVFSHYSGNLWEYRFQDFYLYLVNFYLLLIHVVLKSIISRSF